MPLVPLPWLMACRCSIFHTYIYHAIWWHEKCCSLAPEMLCWAKCQIMTEVCDEQII